MDPDDEREAEDAEAAAEVSESRTGRVSRRTHSIELSTASRVRESPESLYVRSMKNAL